MDNFLDIAYLIAAVSFIYGLKMLSHPKTARNGNIIASAGMLIAIISTVYLGTDLNFKSMYQLIFVAAVAFTAYTNGLSFVFN